MNLQRVKNTDDGRDGQRVLFTGSKNALAPKSIKKGIHNTTFKTCGVSMRRPNVPFRQYCSALIKILQLLGATLTFRKRPFIPRINTLMELEKLRHALFTSSKSELFESIKKGIHNTTS